MARFRRPLIRESRFALIAPTAAVVAYLPVVVVPYAFMDDYYVLAWREGISGEFFKTATSFGRPLHALALSGTFSLAWDIDSLRLTRLVSLVGVMLLAILIYYGLRQAGFCRWLSTCVCVSVVSLASFQVYVAWAAIGEAPYVAALAGFASLRLRSARALQGRAALIRRGESAALLLFALLTYQPAAMFFWVFVAMDVLRPGARLGDAARKLGESLGVAAVALFFAYAAVRIGVHFYGGAFSGRTNLVHDFIGKARWFWTEPLVNSFGMFGLLPTETVALAIALVAAVGILLLHAESGRAAFGFLGLAAALVPLAYLPNLAVAEQFASYRSIGALATLLTLYVWLGLWGIARALSRRPGPLVVLPLAALLSVGAVGLLIIPLAEPGSRASLTSWPTLALLGSLFVIFAAVALRANRSLGIAAAVFAAAAFALIGMLIAARNITTLVVKPQSAELELLRSALNVATAPRRVVFVKPNWNQGPAPLVRYDELGLPSTYFAWVPGPAVLLVLREQAKRMDPAIDIFAWDETPAARGDVFVDMRTLEERSVDWSLWTLEDYDTG